MKHPASLIGVIGLLFLSYNTHLFAQKIAKPAEPESFKNLIWGYSVRDTETGEELVDHDAHTLMTPASTLKLVSTGTALSKLGVSKRLTTRLITTGKIIDQTLYGDLYIKGEGDFSIGSRYFWDEDPDIFFIEAEKSLKSQGIKRIEGQILAVSPESDFQAVSPRWTTYDQGNHYAAGAFELNLLDNSYTLKISNYGKKISLSPHIEGLSVYPAFDFSESRASDSLYISPFPNEKGQILITGTYPAKAATRTIKGAIPNPPLYFAQRLRDKLKVGGIITSGSYGTAKSIPIGDNNTLFSYQSPTLFELAKITNTYSHNLFAEGLLHLLGRDKVPLPGHNLSQTSIMEISHFWKERGLDTKELEMWDGNGLSPENRVTPAFLTALLGKIYRGDPSHSFMFTLPRAGKEGTLAIFLKNTPLEGNARLKSGTIRNVVAYSGYISLKNKVYSVALIVNNYYGKASDLRKEMEKILVKTFF